MKWDDYLEQIQETLMPRVGEMPGEPSFAEAKSLAALAEELAVSGEQRILAKLICLEGMLVVYQPKPWYGEHLVQALEQCLAAISEEGLLEYIPRVRDDVKMMKRFSVLLYRRLKQILAYYERECE